MRKNILVTKCFGVFSRGIAFACIESRLTAARTFFPERCRADLTATLVRTQGGASPAELARPMSRRQITQRRELLLPPGTDWHSKSLPKRVILLDANLEAESCRLATPVSCGIAEPPRYWTRELVPGPAVAQADQTADWPRAELVGATGLLASLVFRQARPGNRSAADAGQRRSSDDRKTGSVLVAAPDAGSQCFLRSKRSDAIARAGAPDPAPAPMEILFTELTARRLRSLATRKKL
jgi:hypothetical protein